MIHERENNEESQLHLFENKDRLSHQCQKVLDILKAGNRLTVERAMISYGIMSLPRRILDLTSSGHKISTSWKKDEKGKNICKEYFIK